VIERLFILGGSGDLTVRYLLPALAELQRADHLPNRLRVTGVGRADHDDDGFRRLARQALAQHGPALAGDVRDAVLARLSWRTADVTDPHRLAELLGAQEQPVVVYLALPPKVYGPVVDALCRTGLPENSVLVVEKPFGTDLDSARDLNRRLARLLPEEAVFRVDHVLARQTVQNILGLRFANRVFEPVWNHVHVSRVDITWDETLALEGRAGYYDRAGALRDMVQNHLLQLLALVAMEPPAGLGARDLRDRKVDVLRATRALTGADTANPPVRARYTHGTVDGRQLPDYIAESGVDPSRATETFAEATLVVDNWRWAGTPFVLRTGKALAADRTEIALHFRPVPHAVFPLATAPEANVLRLRLGPDRISLRVNLNTSGDLLALEPAELGLSLAPQDLSAYARLLIDILDREPTLSIRDDEAEESWRIVAPILNSWQRDEVPLLSYPAGSHGPDRSERGHLTDTR
jgi:glucose-6-phosphate 1-dehydrogenase